MYGDGRGMIARFIEAITNDEEELSSLYILFEDGGHVAIAREMSSDKIYCEYNDQGNGFYPKTLSYQYSKGMLSLLLSDDECFDSNCLVQALSIRIPHISDDRSIHSSLNSIFGDK